jgi:Xaa-Pro aminopeptidase
MNHKITDRLAALRDEMRAQGIEVCVIPNSDPHLSEYLPAHWKCLEWLSGFTGEAATLVVALDDAALWTDSRFFIQAEEQLAGTTIRLMKKGLSETPSIAHYMATHSPAGKFQIDDRLLSQGELEQLTAELSTLRGESSTLLGGKDLVGKLWNDRPSLPQGAAELFEDQYAGESCTARLQRIRQALQPQATHLFLNRLDDIAWALNIRGTDIHCTPVVTAYALISPTGVRLYIDPHKVSPQVANRWAAEGISLADYDEVGAELRALPREVRIVAAPQDTNAALYRCLAESQATIVSAANPIPVMRAVKNATEVAGYRRAMIKDGVALVRFYRRLEQDLAAGQRVTEQECVDRLIECRRTQEYYREESFDAIVAWNEHGALPHYATMQHSNEVIGTDGLLLIDTGGQYQDGTTDITRTVAIGTPNQEMMHDYTLVMKGHIRLATACFPVGTRGDQLDALARMDLWRERKTFRHGTSHGVGFCLGVHEGPESIRMEHNPQVLLPGMVLSNEPAVYRKGRYGVRHENCMLVLPYEDSEATADDPDDMGRYLHFETLTLFPFDTRALQIELLTPEERIWINNYHRSVYERLSPYLNAEEKAWLRSKTQYI